MVLFASFIGHLFLFSLDVNISVLVRKGNNGSKTEFRPINQPCSQSRISSSQISESLISCCVFFSFFAIGFRELKEVYDKVPHSLLIPGEGVYPLIFLAADSVCFSIY